jgi:predicted nucleic acid-binding protein
MSRQMLLGTGPLVAFISPRDRFHEWAVAQWATSGLPLLTCEAVITEACFLLRNVYRGEEEVMNLLETQILHISFSLDNEVATIRQLLSRYQSVPMSLADACLVRMTELYPESLLLTLDSDFTIYWKNQNQPIALIQPKRS